MKKEQSTAKVTPKSPGMPWWTSVLLALGSYCLLKYLLPGLHPENTVLEKLFQLAPKLAPPAAILFLLLAAKQLYDVDIDRNAAGRDDEQDNQNDR